MEKRETDIFLKLLGGLKLAIRDFEEINFLKKFCTLYFSEGERKSAIYLPNVQLLVIAREKPLENNITP